MYIVKSIHRAKPQIVGLKAWNLLRLRKNFAIPEFVVIKTEAFKTYKENNKIFPELANELRKTLTYFLKKGLVAIRSSGTAEDLPGVSFAGMYSTILNTDNVEDGLKAIIRAWESINSARVKSYCEKMGILSGEMAVIVQHQLNPEISGVMVTQSPFTISEVLIECCEGLGDKLVSGEITPTRYRIRDNRIIEQKGQALITQDQLFKLVKKGKKIEWIFKSPQDIEWAIENGKLYILQSRPVLVHAAERRRKGMIWCNANVRETIPDPISPMTWSLFDTVFFPGIMIDTFGFPISEEQYKKFRPVEMLSGRLYWNMNNTLAYGKSIGPIIDFIKGDRAIDPQMAAAFETVDIKHLPKILPASRMFIFSIMSLVRMIYYLLLGYFRYGWMSIKITRANDSLDAFCAGFVPSRDLLVAIDKIRNWTRFVLKKFARRYFGGIFLGGFNLALLSILLSLRMGKKGEARARKAIIGIIDKTGEMAISINRLASLAREKLKVMNVSSLKRLYQKDREFHASIEKFLIDFGHRGPAEFDVASPNWREDHTMLYRIIAAAKDSNPYSVDRPKIVKAMLESARPYERFMIKTFAPRLEVYTPLRENGKHFYLKATAKVKDQLVLIGDRLVNQGYIRHPRDVFFLTLRDLEGIARETKTKREVDTMIGQRKRQWYEYQRAEVPDIIYETGERITTSIVKSNVLYGEPLSFGKIKARVCIISDFSKSHRLKEGKILVTHHADPGWTPLFTIASGVIIEVGGIICHAAMVARELGIPAVVIKGATSLIPDGAFIELDADSGVVSLR